MKHVKLWSFLALTLVACAASEGNPEDTAATDQDIALRRGNIDSVAVVESGTMMLAGGPIDLNLDAYNAEDPMAAKPGRYAPVFAERLAAFDDYDGKTDWTPEQAQAWAARMSTGNFQIIDTSKPCDFANPHTYLEIERAQLTGREHTTCGGRMPNEDALDVTVNFLIRGPAASAAYADAVSDGVDRATKPSTEVFPYLADLN
jgi:hypothetical protein